MAKYKDKYIAFIDILGFRKKVDESLKDQIKYKNIQSALKTFVFEKKNKIKIEGENVTTFSDSIIISYPAENTDNLFLLGKTISYLQNDLYKYGILIRGGITKGKIYHTKEYVFGPGFNEAYELESKYAVYPRIIMYKEFYDQKIEEFKLSTYCKEEENIFKKVFAVDSLTDIVYVDTLNCKDDYESEEEYYNFLKQVKTLIEDNLTGSTNSKEIKAKYIWLANYYNKNLKKNKIKNEQLRISKNKICYH